MSNKQMTTNWAIGPRIQDATPGSLVQVTDDRNGRAQLARVASVTNGIPTVPVTFTNGVDIWTELVRFPGKARCGTHHRNPTRQIRLGQATATNAFRILQARWMFPGI